MNTLARSVVLAIVVAVSAIGDVQAQSGDAIAKQFEGMWRLVSRTQRFTDGTSRLHPVSMAYLIYTDVGRMCYVAMDPNRPQWKSAGSPTPEEALTGITGFSAYCASVRIYAQEGVVEHDVDIERVPNIVGRTRKRRFSFQGSNRVTLQIDAKELTAPLVDDTLVWERVTR